METDQLYGLLVTYTEQYIIIERDKESEVKKEIGHKIDALLAEIKLRK